MPKVQFIYCEPTESRPKPTPEEMQALGAAWYAWMQKFSTAILPGGDGLKHTGRVLKGGLVTDGPYVEAKEIVVSFTLIQADDRTRARLNVRMGESAMSRLPSWAANSSSR